jgi:hypothetical protein
MSTEPNFDTLRERLRERNIWTMRDGQRIPIREMSDAHLVNTIRYLRRTAHLALLRSVAAFKMSEAAEMALGTEFDNLEEDACVNAVPAFRVMVAEAEKRGLKP